MDGGNSPRRVVNRLFLFFLRFRRPATPPLRTMQNVTIHGKEHEKHEEHEKRKTRNSTHVWSSNPESERKKGK